MANKKRPIYKVCALEGCNQTFKSHGRQAYHHEDCRKKAQTDEKARVQQHEAEMYEKSKALAKAKTGSAKNIGVDPKFLTRGKIKYEGYTSL